MKVILASLIAAGLLLTGCNRVPDSVAATPATYPELIAAGQREGGLSIYSNTDSAEAEPLIEAFRKRYPGIAVEYADQSSVEMYSRFIAEVAAGQGSADVLWGSAMDLQLKLAADGYAQPYHSRESDALLPGSNWRDMVYATTREPIVIAYNKRMIPAAQVPRTHADLVRLLRDKPERWKGRVGMLDPERSGLGFLFYANDMQTSPVAKDVLDALGAIDPKLYSSNGAVLERLVSGEHAITYNMIGSYMLKRQKKDPNVGVIYPTDYTMTMSRLALIPKAARHPSAAKLFMDFLLSAEAQTLLAANKMAPVRADMGDGGVGFPAGANFKPIKVDESLLGELDPVHRLALLQTWRRAVRDR